MKTLKWKDGACVNPPVHVGVSWELLISRYVEDDYGYTAYLFAGNHRWVRHFGSRGYPTKEAAELACETALWRLGVLPLPKWGGAPEGFSLPHDDTCAFCVIPGVGWARIVKNSGAWEWRATVDTHKTDGKAPRIARGAEIWRERAVEHAEACLRALIAAQVEAQNAIA